MARKKRTATASLVNELLLKARQFEFYQAVRILLSSAGGGTPAGAASAGGDGPVELETLRFRPSANLNFAPADLERIERLGDGEENQPRYRMTVNFLGLYGAASPLPAFYTEDIISGNEEESSRRDFFDLFHHRYIALLFRCWEKYRFYLRHRLGGKDRATQWIASLAALEDNPETGAPPVPKRERLLACLGLLMQGSRSAALLERVLSHTFEGLPVTVQQYVLRHVTIRPEQRARLGAANSSLGLDCTLGARVPDIAGRFRLAVGPLDFAGFLRFLPDGDRHILLLQIMPFLLKDQLDHDLALGIKREEVPILDLSADNPCRLGWSTWLAADGEEDRVVVLPLRS